MWSHISYSHSHPCMVHVVHVVHVLHGPHEVHTSLSWSASPLPSSFFSFSWPISPFPTSPSSSLVNFQTFGQFLQSGREARFPHLMDGTHFCHLIRKAWTALGIFFSDQFESGYIFDTYFFEWIHIWYIFGWIHIFQSWGCCDGQGALCPPPNSLVKWPKKRDENLKSPTKSRRTPNQRILEVKIISWKASVCKQCDSPKQNL